MIALLAGWGTSEWSYFTVKRIGCYSQSRGPTKPADVHPNSDFCKAQKASCVWKERNFTNSWFLRQEVIQIGEIR